MAQEQADPSVGGAQVWSAEAGDTTQWPEQWTEGLDMDMLMMGRTTPDTTDDAMRRATEFGAHLHLPRSALRSSLPSWLGPKDAADERTPWVSTMLATCGWPTD